MTESQVLNLERIIQPNSAFGLNITNIAGLLIVLIPP